MTYMSENKIMIERVAQFIAHELGLEYAEHKDMLDIYAASVLDACERHSRPKWKLKWPQI